MSQLMYSGVFTQAAGGEYSIGATDFNSFLSQDRFNAGFRITSFDVTVIDGQVRYAGVVHPGSGAQYLQAATDWATFVSWSNTQFANGLRITSLSTCEVDGAVRYAAVVRDGFGTGAQWVSPTTAWDAFVKWNNDQFAKGNSLVALATCEIGGTVLYTGVVRSSAVGGAEWAQAAQPFNSFYTWVSDLFSKGFHLTSLSTVYHAGDVLYTGVMRTQPGAMFIVPAMSIDNFVAQEISYFNQGFHLTAMALTTAVPRTATWQLNPSSAGKVDFSGGTVIAKDDGTWQFYGSLHDNSTWYGDNWSFGFVIGGTGHGAIASGSLGAEFSGPAVNGSFNMAGNDPWIAANWEQVYNASIHASLRVVGDVSGLVSAVAADLKTYGPAVVELVGAVVSA
jgi:hypothetical protein